MDFDDFFGFLSLTIRRYSTVSHVPMDFKLYKELVNIKRKKFKKFGVPGILLSTFLKQYVEKSTFFPEKYVFYTLAYSSTLRDDAIMSDTSLDCASSLQENEGSMNKIR